MSVLGALQIGYFEVAFLVALCVVMVLARALPWLDDRLFGARRRDREDFRSLAGDAKKVREGYAMAPERRAALPEAERLKASDEHHDLEVHLELLGVHFFFRDQNLYRDLALLIKLMERGDLKKARQQWPMPSGVEAVPS